METQEDEIMLKIVNSMKQVLKSKDAIQKNYDLYLSVLDLLQFVTCSIICNS